MINSHYVPRLILRHFADAERIQYCDLDQRQTTTRNIRSAFAEKGYYPDEIEKEMCYKIESQFANLLNNKILNERHCIVLTREELFILKKYLIITTIRYNCTEAYRNFGNSEAVVQGYSANFFANINKVLACKNAKELGEYMDVNPFDELDKIMNGDIGDANRLFMDIKNILHSYIVFVSTHKCGENFIIPDTGYIYQATPLSMFSEQEFDKCTYTLFQAMYTRNPDLFYVAQMLTPYDMIFCPVSKDLAIVSLSVFYKFFNRNSDIYGLLSTEGLTVNELLGFGSANTVEPPKVKYQYNKSPVYKYKVQQLSLQDVLSLNTGIINTAEHFFGFCSKDGIKSSIEYYEDIPAYARRYDLSFLHQSSKP